MTDDKFTQAARELRNCSNPHCDHGICAGERCWTCGGDGFLEPDADKIAAALRRAAEEARAEAFEEAAKHFDENAKKKWAEAKQYPVSSVSGSRLRATAEAWAIEYQCIAEGLRARAAAGERK